MLCCEGVAIEWKGGDRCNCRGLLSETGPASMQMNLNEQAPNEHLCKAAIAASASRRPAMDILNAAPLVSK